MTTADRLRVTIVPKPSADQHLLLLLYAAGARRSSLVGRGVPPELEVHGVQPRSRVAKEREALTRLGPLVERVVE